MGYAISQFRPLARIGTLASAMGKTSAEFNQGLYTGHRYTRGAGDLLNPQAQRMVRQDGLRRSAARGHLANRRSAAQQTPPPPPGGPSGGTTP